MSGEASGGSGSEQGARRPESTGVQSTQSAHDDALAEAFAIDSAADEHESAEDAQRVAASVPLRPAPDAQPSSAEPADDAEPLDAGDPAAAPAAGTGPDTVAGSGGAEGKRGRTRPRRKAPWWELPILVVVAIIVAVLVKTFVVQPFYIPSESMEKTLHGCTGCAGDRIVVNKPIFDLRDPHPGDIIVFTAPSGWEQEAVAPVAANPFVKAVRWFGQLVGVVPPDQLVLVKRVIAVGGQTVQCCDSEGRVQISDHGTAGPWRSLNEPYVYRDLDLRPDYWQASDTPNGQVAGQDTRTFGPVTVPAGRLWVMGDHRNDSADSSFHWRSNPTDTAADTVAVDSVIGKAVVIAWPPSRWRTLGTPSTFSHAAAAGLPVGAGAVAVLPVWGLRRRRRGTSAGTRKRGAA